MISLPGLKTNKHYCMPWLQLTFYFKIVTLQNAPLRRQADILGCSYYILVILSLQVNLVVFVKSQ